MGRRSGGHHPHSHELPPRVDERLQADSGTALVPMPTSRVGWLYLDLPSISFAHLSGLCLDDVPAGNMSVRHDASTGTISAIRDRQQR